MSERSDDTLLIVEDDAEIRDALASGFTLDGYTVREAPDLKTARSQRSAGGIDLVLLDVMLPYGSGLDFLAEIRRDGVDTLVLVLTARGAEEDRVSGFEHGCDDYVIKPFSLDELRWRVRSLLRRSRKEPTKAPEVVQIGSAQIDLEGYRVERDGRSMKLSPKEREMIALFLAEPGVVITRHRFLNEVWGYDRFPTTRTVDMHILKLRQKIEVDEKNPRHFVTIHGAGYRYDP